MEVAHELATQPKTLHLTEDLIYESNSIGTRSCTLSNYFIYCVTL